MPELSVVVLCYRSEEFASELANQITKELEEASIDYELVLVANYLTDIVDRTPQIVHEYAKTNDRCIVVAKEKEGMMGWDMRSGLEASTCKYIAVIDGDGQMPTSDIVKVYNVLKVNNYDFVKTFRATRQDGFYRGTISSVYNFLFRLLYPSTRMLRDVNSKPKVFTREAYEKMNLVSNDWFTDSEIMIEASKNKLNIGEVSTVFYENERRKSFVAPGTIFEFIYNLFYYRFWKPNND